VGLAICLLGFFNRAHHPKTRATMFQATKLHTRRLLVYDCRYLHFGKIGGKPLPTSVRLNAKYAYFLRVLIEENHIDADVALTPQQRLDLLSGPEEELAKKIIGSKLVLCTRTLLVCM
jgi:hypothetical protein